MMVLQYAAQKVAMIRSIRLHDGGGAYWRR